MVLMVIVCKDKENKSLFLYRMVRILMTLLLLIVPLLYYIIQMGPTTTRQWFIVVEKSIRMDVNSILKAVVAMIGCYYSFDIVYPKHWNACLYREDYRNKEWSILHQDSTGNYISH